MKVAVGRGLYEIPSPSNQQIESALLRLTSELNRRVNGVISTNGFKTQSNEFILLTTALELLHEATTLRAELETQKISQVNNPTTKTSLDGERIDHSKAKQLTLDDAIDNYDPPANQDHKPLKQSVEQAIKTDNADIKNDECDIVLNHLEDLLNRIKLALLQDLKGGFES